MGVKGLATLLETHGRIYREVQFMNRRLVIDGFNLIYLLYFYSGLDQNHGGEYAAFEDLVEKFITNLRHCGITPYVVLDGGTDPTDKKFDTLKQRGEDRIKKAHQAAVDGSQKNILPQLVKLVFIQTMARLEVPLAQCFGEADQEIAALAQEWECPVLSNDSDFYIFDLPGGLLPISHFRWEEVKRRGSQSYILCKSYRTSSFFNHFNIQPRLLPTFAALAGNDYVNLHRMKSAISWTEFCPANSGTPSRLEGLLRWLKGFDQPHEAFEAALGLMGELTREKKAEVLNGLNLGMEEYKFPPSSLKKFFIHGTAPVPPQEDVAGLIPDWMRHLLVQARLTPDILDVLLLHRIALSSTVDHADMPSARLTSRPLRQLMYGLLLGKSGKHEVKELDRDGLQLVVIPVQPVFTRITRRLILSSLDKADPSQRLQVLLEALGVTEDSLSRLPPQLRLPMAITGYWLQRAQPPPDERLLKALLLGMTNEGSLRHREALQIPNKHFKQSLDVGVTHAVNQWQGCLKDGIHLNQLLGFPLPEPEIARLYEGTLVHQLIHLMSTGGKLKPVLKSDRSSVKQYQTMLGIVHQFRTQEAQMPSETQRRPTVQQQQRGRQPLDDLTANLQLFLLYDNDEEDLSMVKVQEDPHLDDPVLVKTRYKAKARNNRSNNPELARKQECRGRDLL